MNDFMTLFTFLTQGTFGMIITIALIVITSIAITRNIEKALTLMLPLTIGYTAIGFGQGNIEMGIWLTITIVLYIVTIAYESRYLAPKLASAGVTFGKGTLNNLKGIGKYLDKRKKEIAKKDLIEAIAPKEWLTMKKLMLGDTTELDILQLPLGDAYKLLKIAKIQTGTKIGKDEDKIKNGIKIKFKLHNYLDGNYTKKPKQDLTIIEHQVIPTQDFKEEIDNREALIKNIIIELMQEEDIFKPRE